MTLPKIATVLKASVGIAAQPSLIPLYLDPKVGNPHLLPERSARRAEIARTRLLRGAFLMAAFSHYHQRPLAELAGWKS